MNRTAARQHSFQEQDVRAGSSTCESYACIHGSQLLLQQFLHLTLLCHGKPWIASIRRIDHVTGKDDQLRDGEAVVEPIGVTIKLAGQGTGLFSRRRKSAQVIALRGDGRAIGAFRRLGITQDDQCFRDSSVLPVVVRLRLTDFQDRLSYATGLVRLLEEKRDGCCVYAWIRIRRWKFESAVIVVEGLPQVMFIIRVCAPSILAGASQNA